MRVWKGRCGWGSKPPDTRAGSSGCWPSWTAGCGSGMQPRSGRRGCASKRRTHAMPHKPELGSAWRRDLFVKILEEARRRYRFVVHGYVVMPRAFSSAHHGAHSFAKCVSSPATCFTVCPIHPSQFSTRNRSRFADPTPGSGCDSNIPARAARPSGDRPARLLARD
jgi:hypothetical protein